MTAPSRPLSERFEAHVVDCEIEGKLPRDMNGAFVRVGGQWFYPPMFPDDAPLNSDGYVSSFRIHDGRAQYRGRWIETPRFEANRRAGRQLYGYYRNAFTDDPTVRDPDSPQLRTVANTAPIAHAGKLFALKEDGLPIRLDPASLATLGSWDFDGAYASQTFTAHPKLDPLSGEMIAYGYEATGAASDDLFVYAIDRGGTVTSERRFKVPYVSMMHDIALTQEHIVFPFGGYVTSRERLEAGRIHWGWDSAQPSYIGILPRNGASADMRWFRGPERCMMHTFNAHTDGASVVLDAPFWDSNFFPFFPNVDGAPYDPARARARIRRFRFDLNSSSETWTEEILFAADVDDRGRIDPRYLTLPNRYGFAGFRDPARPVHERLANLRPPAVGAYGRFEFSTRALEAYHAPDYIALGECCFVPRTAAGDEGDGYLIGVASDYRSMHSEMIVLDAQRLADGPLARVLLPFMSTTQIHGLWVSEAELDFTEREECP